MSPREWKSLGWFFLALGVAGQLLGCQIAIVLVALCLGVLSLAVSDILRAPRP